MCDNNLKWKACRRSILQHLKQSLSECTSFLIDLDEDETRFYGDTLCRQTFELLLRNDSENIATYLLEYLFTPRSATKRDSIAKYHLISHQGNLQLLLRTWEKMFLQVQKLSEKLAPPKALTKTQNDSEKTRDDGRSAAAVSILTRVDASNAQNAAGTPTLGTDR